MNMFYSVVVTKRYFANVADRFYAKILPETDGVRDYCEDGNEDQMGGHRVFAKLLDLDVDNVVKEE